MNKSQELQMKIMKAKQKAKERIEEHKKAWYGQEPKIIENPVKREE